MCAGERPEIVEPVPVGLEFVHGLAAMEDMGANALLVLYERHRSYEAAANIWTVSKRIVMPWDGVIEGLRLATAVAARRAGRVLIGKAR